MTASEPSLRIGYTKGQDVTLDRLQDQIEWYDKQSNRNQRAFKILKVLTMATAASVPAVAGVQAPPAFTASLGVAIVVLEGLQQLNQYQANWIAYRSTCEALKHEKYLYHARAGAYQDASNARLVLAERIEALVSQEHAKWASSREQAEAGKSSRAAD